MTAIGSAVLAALVVELWNADVSVPMLRDGDDRFFYEMLAKGLIDNGD